MKKLISLVIAMALVVCLLPVAYAANAELHLDTTEYTGYQDQELWISAYDENGDAFSEILTWTSSDPAVADVVSGYMNDVCIALVTPGTATITAECGSLSATCTITVKSPEVLALDTPMALSDDAIATFTATEAGSYTFYFPETNIDVGGYVYTNNGYGDIATATNGQMQTASIEMAAGETAAVHTTIYGNGDQTPNYKLAVVKTPALESLTLNTDKVEVIYISSTFQADGMVYLTPNPTTAAIPANLTWKMKDPTVAQIDYDFGGYCYFSALKVGQTVLEVYDGETLVDSAEIVIKGAEEVAQELYWGVEYDVVEDEDMIFLYTPSATDTLTFASTCEQDAADPCVDILAKVQGEWTTIYHFDDYGGLNFYGEAQLEKDTQYMIRVSNYYFNTGFSFTVKGTDATNPGYQLKKVDAKPASCTAEGNIEYYLCQKTGIKFANAEATKLAGEVVIPKVAHKLDKVAAVAATSEKEGNIAHEKCSVCGALFVEGKEVKAADVVIAKLDNPATGDNTMVLPVIALAVLSITGLAVTVIGKKKAI